MAITTTDSSGRPYTLRDYLDRRTTALTNERESFIAQWRTLADFVKPRRGRFAIEDRNKGDRRWSNIINSTATQALRTARGGFMAGTMSPARPWFALGTPDEDMMEFQPVKIWLSHVETILRTIFTSSNFYGMAPTTLQELLLFGTGAMSHLDDFDNVARFYSHTIGSYMLGLDSKLRVRTFVREYQMQVNQIVEQFGLENCSQTVKTAYDRGSYDSWYPVTHFVEPNPEHDPRKKLARFKPFRSIYYEPGNKGTTNAEQDRFLSRSGFDEFPVHCPRWEVTGEDIYGTDCPGMTALGDVKGLQVQEKRKAQGIDKMVNPPLQGPPSLRNTPVNSLPGGVTIYSGDANGQKLETLYQVNPQLQELRLDMDAMEKRINSAFYVDLFLAISQMEGIQPRNQFDLMQRHQERLLQLGPVLEQIHNEFLGPIIERTFNQAVRADILPQAPEELRGQDLKITYISPLALAQRAVATGNIERAAAFVASMMQMDPAAIDKFDVDQAIDEYSVATGAPPRIIVPDEIVAQKRQARAMQQQLAAAAQLANSGADTANKLANAQASEPSVLSNLSDAVSQRTGANSRGR